MALIADKTTSKKLQNRLNEFSKLGMTLYYLFENGRININELERLFFSSDDEKSCLVYANLIKKVKSSDLKESFNKYSLEYPNTNLLEKDKYEDKLNLLYTEKIINTILSFSHDNIDKIYINTYNYLLVNNCNN